MRRLIHNDEELDKKEAWDPKEESLSPDKPVNRNLRKYAGINALGISENNWTINWPILRYPTELNPDVEAKDDHKGKKTKAFMVFAK